MNKGFTLIELLAVIVILAIIALIATPIVLGIINDSKESSIIRSGEFYIDAVKNSIMQENMKLGGTLNPSECIVNPEGNVTCDGTNLEIEVEGEKPSGGSITFSEGKATGVNLTFGNKNVSMNANGQLVLGDYQICKLISGNSNEIGSKYECEVKPGTKYNFYVLSHEDDGTINLIMERNICEDGTVATSEKACTVAWITDEDYGCVKENNEESCATVYKGPVTAMNYLNQATSTWINVKNLNITYNDFYGYFNAFEVIIKVRLPYHHELINVGCQLARDRTCPIWVIDFMEDTLKKIGQGKYQNNSMDGIYGYWIFSTSFLGSEKYGGSVYSNGMLEGGQIFTSNYFGVRPVINVKL